MSTISASTTSTTAYKVTADTTGTLVFQTGSVPTTALTIGSDQSVTFAGAQTYTGGATFTSGITVQGITVGRGAGAQASNTAVGANALVANTGGYENVAIGTISMNANTSGTFNTAVGRASLYSNTIGNYNTANGNGALQTNTTGSNNTAVGYQAGYSGTTAANNVYLGRITGYSNVSSANNTFVGDAAGYSTTSAANTFVGAGAGYYVTSGAKNTILGGYNGNQGGLDIRTASNYIVLSDGDGNPRLVYPNSSTLTTYGSVAIGPATGTSNSSVSLLNNPDAHSASTVPSSITLGGAGGFQVLSVRNGANTFNNSYLAFNVHIGAVFAGVRAYLDLSGNFYPAADNASSIGISGNRWSAIWAANGTIQTSDARKKTDVQDSVLGLNFIKALRPVSYKWLVGKNEVKTDFDSEKDEFDQHKQIVTPVAGERTHFGLLSQQVKEALGDQDFGGYVYDKDSDTYALRYDQFVAPLIKAVQELSSQLEELKAELDTAKAQIAALQGAA